MSSSAALGVTPWERPTHLAEFRNGHGWSPSIWSRLIRHRYDFDGYYLDGPGEEYLDRLWKSVEEQPPWQQVANVLTFDTGVIPRNDYNWAADQLLEFERRLPAPDGHVNHVPAVAELLGSGRIEEPFFGMWGTSVSENPFDPWNDDADDWGTGLPLRELYLLPQHREAAIAEFDKVTRI